MKTSFFRIMLMVLAGGYITIMGYSSYSATPLLVITGVVMMAYGMIAYLTNHNFSDNAPQASRTAHPCQEMNHAGCQDNPDCVCGCHRERIVISVNS